MKISYVATAVAVALCLVTTAFAFSFNPVETIIGVKVLHPNDPNPIGDVILITQGSAGVENQWRCAEPGVPGETCWVLGSELPGQDIEVQGLGSIVWPDTAATIKLLP